MKAPKINRKEGRIATFTVGLSKLMLQNRSDKLDKDALSTERYEKLNDNERQRN